jgi:ABC-type dipeptide/oligopeptide/nickel transport system ATPase component
LADRVLFFDGGRIVAVQPVEDFFSRPSHPAACAFLAQAPPTA